MVPADASAGFVLMQLMKPAGHGYATFGALHALFKSRASK
jgi:hypothetical protein